MEMPWNWCVQNRRSGWFSQIMGNPKEPPFNELWQNVTRSSLLLPCQHLTKSSRRTSLLPVSRTIFQLQSFPDMLQCSNCFILVSCRFLRNPTELKSIKNISLLRTQPPPAMASSNQTVNNKASDNHSNTSNGNTQMGSHLNVQSLLHSQQPPPSPRVHALNGAFHYLSTSAVPDRSSPPQSHSSSQSDMDDQPTDLSTSGRTSNPDCYP